MRCVFILIGLIHCFSSIAGTLIENLTITSLSLDQKHDNYYVSFLEKAADYKANIKWVKCLDQSLSKKTPVVIHYDPQTLQIADCKDR